MNESEWRWSSGEHLGLAHQRSRFESHTWYFIFQVHKWSKWSVAWAGCHAVRYKSRKKAEYFDQVSSPVWSIQSGLTSEHQITRTLLVPGGIWLGVDKEAKRLPVMEGSRERTGRRHNTKSDSVINRTETDFERTRTNLDIRKIVRFRLRFRKGVHERFLDQLKRQVLPHHRPCKVWELWAFSLSKH